MGVFSQIALFANSSNTYSLLLILNRHIDITYVTGKRDAIEVTLKMLIGPPDDYDSRQGLQLLRLLVLVVRSGGGAEAARRERRPQCKLHAAVAGGGLGRRRRQRNLSSNVRRSKE